MSSTKKPKELFTPGPWFGVLLQSPFYGKRVEIRAKESNLWIASTSGCAGGDDELANAYLIVTAPEMYEMLGGVLRYMQASPLSRNPIIEGQLADLLARARGEVLE
jgi:hypothetical protein